MSRTIKQKKTLENFLPRYNQNKTERRERETERRIGADSVRRRGGSSVRRRGTQLRRMR